MKMIEMLAETAMIGLVRNTYTSITDSRCELYRIFEYALVHNYSIPAELTVSYGILDFSGESALLRISRRVSADDNTCHCV